MGILKWKNKVCDGMDEMEGLNYLGTWGTNSCYLVQVKYFK